MFRRSKEKRDKSAAALEPMVPEVGLTPGQDCPAIEGDFEEGPPVGESKGETNHVTLVVPIKASSTDSRDVDARLALLEAKSKSHRQFQISDTEAALLDLFDLISKNEWKHVLNKIENSSECSRSKGIIELGEQTTEAYPLHLAVTKKPPVHVVEALIHAYPRAVQRTDKELGQLPLHIACCCHAKAQVLKALLLAFPDSLRIADKVEGRLPLHYACLYGSPHDVSMLVAGDKHTVAVKDSGGKTALDLANESTNPNREVIAKRLQDHAKVMEASMKKSKRDGKVSQYLSHLKSPNRQSKSKAKERKIQGNMDEGITPETLLLPSLLDDSVRRRAQSMDSEIESTSPRIMPTRSKLVAPRLQASKPEGGNVTESYPSSIQLNNADAESWLPPVPPEIMIAQPEHAISSSLQTDKAHKSASDHSRIPPRKQESTNQGPLNLVQGTNVEWTIREQHHKAIYSWSNEGSSSQRLSRYLLASKEVPTIEADYQSMPARLTEKEISKSLTLGRSISLGRGNGKSISYQQSQLDMSRSMGDHPIKMGERNHDLNSSMPALGSTSQFKHNSLQRRNEKPAKKEPHRKSIPGRASKDEVSCMQFLPSYLQATNSGPSMHGHTKQHQESVRSDRLATLGKEELKASSNHTSQSHRSKSMGDILSLLGEQNDAEKLDPNNGSLPSLIPDLNSERFSLFSVCVSDDESSSFSLNLEPGSNGTSNIVEVLLERDQVRKKDKELSSLELQLQNLELRREALLRECDHIRQSISQNRDTSEKSSSKVVILQQKLLDIQAKLEKEQESVEMAECSIEHSLETLCEQSTKIHHVDEEKKFLLSIRQHLVDERCALSNAALPK